MMLDSRVLEAPLLDHRGLDLDAAGRVTYVLEQSFRYEYDAPVESLRQRLVVVPPARHGNQYRRAHRLDVHGVQARRSVRRDANGNVVALLRAERGAGSDELDDAVSAFLALALADAGAEREAVSVALAALGPHLPRYQRAVGNYARLLAEPEPRD